MSNPYLGNGSEERFAPHGLPPVPSPPDLMSQAPVENATGYPQPYSQGQSRTHTNAQAGATYYARQPYMSTPQGDPLNGFGYADTTTQGAATKRVRGKIGFGTVVGLMLASVLAGAAGGAWVAANDSDPGREAATINQVQPGTPSAERPDGSIADVAAKVLPSVVYIEVATKDGAATGSGFVISENGYILTNNHVVAEGADGAELRVTFSDGSEEVAQLIGRAVEYDIAVIKVAKSGLSTLTLGDSDNVVVGDPVIAVGAPLGLEGTVTTGIVSALNRPVTAGETGTAAYINAIQTDAAINPGNSGGPLVNSAGEVIGINSAIAQTPSQVLGTTAGNIGLGFAISSNQAARTSKQIIDKGFATFPIIGVLLDSSYTGEGVQVTTSAQGGVQPVTPDGPADRAGIVAGDIILAIDGRPVSQSDELIVSIRSRAPGETVTLTLRNGDSQRDVKVTLGEAKSE
ncbi:S1C family serine protease [Timonella senegalensis]|uniref:S1C family serine protease n=1 Tax=Timonella senegalensis TaxID=1465825 RepID=UPI001E39E145|nr:trypsin-like peptidase domain-containing protein [Timonella senegalensis]